MDTSRSWSRGLELPPRWLGIVGLTVLILLLFAVPAALNIGPRASPIVVALLALGLGLLLTLLVDLPPPVAQL